MVKTVKVNILSEDQIPPQVRYDTAHALQDPFRTHLHIRFSTLVSSLRFLHPRVDETTVKLVKHATQGDLLKISSHISNRIAKHTDATDISTAPGMMRTEVTFHCSELENYTLPAKDEFDDELDDFDMNNNMQEINSDEKEVACVTFSLREFKTMVICAQHVKASVHIAIDDPWK